MVIGLELEGVDAVELRLSRESAVAWARWLARSSTNGLLGEPGEELRAELARALGDEEDVG